MPPENHQLRIITSGSGVSEVVRIEINPNPPKTFSNQEPKSTPVKIKGTLVDRGGRR